jgi:hypothetical protein
VQDLFTEQDFPDGVALDVAKGKMYWTDYNNGRIKKGNMDGTGNVEVLVQTIVKPSGIVLDLSSNKIYWVDETAKKIQRANLDGSNIEDLVTGLGRPLWIALDIDNGKMYWTDDGTDKIQRANLDGSNIEDIISSGIITPDGIALDLINNKIYWVDDGTDKIQKANLDGTSVEDILLKKINQPRFIELDMQNKKLYWYEVNKLQKANLDGSSLQTAITPFFGGSMTGLSLNIPKNEVFWSSPSSGISKANLTSGITTALISAGLRPNGLDLDLVEEKMYWTSTLASDLSIKRTNFNGSNIENIINVNFPFRLAIDKSVNKIYWYESGTNKMRRANLNGSVIEDIFVEDGILNFKLDTLENKIYWISNIDKKIKSSNMDGSDVKNIVTTSSGFSLSICPATKVSIQSSQGNTICAGTNVTFTAIPVFGGNSPTYQWLRNGFIVGNNSPVYTLNNLANGDRIECKITSSNGCSGVAISSPITMTVIDYVTPSVSIKPIATVCEGTNVTFEALPENGGDSPQFIWYKLDKDNKIIFSSNLQNTPFYPFASVSTNEKIQVKVISNAPCLTTKENTSVPYLITTTPKLPISVNLSANIRQGQPICNGDTLTFVAEPVNQGSNPTYEWFIGNTKVATTTENTFRTNQFPANTNPINVFVRMTSSYPCTSNNPATSSNFSFRTQNSPAPSLSLQPLDGISFCTGEVARFKANSVGGGVEPNYQWFVNNVPQGNLSTQEIFSSITLQNGDIIRTEMVSSLQCANPREVSSQPIVVEVKPAPNVEIRSNQGLVICQGNNLILEAVVTNATNPTYQWRKNGNDIVGATGRTYTISNIQAADNQASIDVVMNSSNVSCKNSRAIANPVSLQVSNSFVPQVSIRSRQGSRICAGSRAFFEIGSVNVPVSKYEWQVDGVKRSEQPLFDVSNLQNGQKVRLIITTDLTCTSSKTATSTEFVVNTQALAPPSRVVAEAKSQRSIELRWQDNSVGETRFVIERAISNDNNNSFVTYRNVLDTISTFFIDNDVLPQTTYFYRVRAVNTDIPDCQSSVSEKVGAITDGEDLVTALPLDVAKIVKIYPNPSTNGIFYLDWLYHFTGEIKLELYNTLQAQTWQQTHQKLSQDPRLVLDLSQQSAGIYWLKLQIGKHARFIKLVKY